LLDSLNNRKKQCENTAVILCSRNNHYYVVKPVIEELQQRGWRTKTLRFETVGETLIRIEKKINTLKKHDTTLEDKIKKQKKKRNQHVAITTYLLSYILGYLIMRKPDRIIVMTDGPLLERALILLGRRLRIPSLRLQIGIVGYQYESGEFMVDKMAVTGQIAKDIIMKTGIAPSDKLVVTGSPVYDRLVKADKFFSKEPICRNLSLDLNRKIVVFASENLSPEKNRMHARVVCRVMKNFPEVQFVIKVHPAERDILLYESIAREMGRTCVVIRDFDIHQILYVSDIVILCFSTTGLEAMILKKPLIILCQFMEKPPVDYASEGAAIRTRTEQELRDTIKELLENEQARHELAKNRDTFIYKYAYIQDGKSTERVCDLIEDMSKRKKNVMKEYMR